MLSVDDEEIEVILLVIDVAMEEANSKTMTFLDAHCRKFCLRQVNALRARILQYQEDIEEEKENG
jgi:hypothetical protein